MEVELPLSIGRVRVRRLIVAGWTGRDRAAVQKHIDELAAEGVSPPERVPMLYRATLDRLTTADEIQVVGDRTSGEAEPVLLIAGGKVYAGIGSDHTDRELERHSVQDSKQACPKPVGREFWPLDDIGDRWDSLELRSWSDGELYQEGHAGALLPPDEILRLCGGTEDGTLILMGTVATRGGLRFGRRFECELRDGSRALRCGYTVQTV